MKTPLSLLFVLLLLSGCAQPAAPQPSAIPQSATPSPLPPTAAPPPTRTPAATRTPAPTPTPTVTRSLEYCRVDDRPLLLDAHAPTAGSAPYPAVIFLHGGGWTQGGRREADGLPVVRALLHAGYYVFSVEYRLAPVSPFPAQIQDARCAVRWLRANAQQFNVNPGAIAAMGTSAGGHLAALLGTTAGDARWPSAGGFADQPDGIQAVVDFYAPVELSVLYEVGLRDLAERVFSASAPDDPLLRAASPLTYVDADDAPFLILHGDADRQVPLSQSELLHTALQTAGVESQLIVVQKGNHGFTGSGFNPGWEEINAAIVTFLDAHLR